MSTIKEQRMNTFLALGVLAGVIAVVCVIGILTFHKETEYVQGKAEVTEYRVSSKVPGRILLRCKKAKRCIKATLWPFSKPPKWRQRRHRPKPSSNRRLP